MPIDIFLVSYFPTFPFSAVYNLCFFHPKIGFKDIPVPSVSINPQKYTTDSYMRWTQLQLSYKNVIN